MTRGATICVGFTCPKCKQHVAVYRMFHDKPTPHPKQDYVSCTCGYQRWCGYSEITKLEKWTEFAANNEGVTEKRSPNRR